MPTIHHLTIAILTHRRPTQLRQCLASLKKQLFQPAKILVLKNSPKYNNIPKKRNLAIDRCRTKYLAFIDDDCQPNPDWVYQAYHFINTHPDTAFVVGKTLLLNQHSQIARVQFNNYQNWFNHHHPLDTKNVIFRLSHLKKLRFDSKFDIFEDVDFDLQLKTLHLTGGYNPKMIVHHPEPENLWTAVKKSYIRGQYKSHITKKWGNFDKFSPQLKLTSNFIKSLLDSAFSLGYLHHRPRPTTIVNHIDSGANGYRLHKFEHFLHNHHCYVESIDSQKEFQKVIASKKYYLVYGFTLFKYKLLKHLSLRYHLKLEGQVFIQMLWLRQKIIHRLLTKNNSSLAIIQYPEDMLVCLHNPRRYHTLYDSPTLYALEIKQAKLYNSNIINQLETLEKNTFYTSDYVSFHWYTYFNLAKKNKIIINHPVTLNWGCNLSNRQSKIKIHPKIIYLGKLNSYWVNPPLINNISQQTNMEIYSYEQPDQKLYPNLLGYHGYLDNNDDLSKYQFGLISLSKDDLRATGFSAKYLLYLNYGLPILCPEWRYDPLLEPATIYYNETNIKKVIEKYSHPKRWQQKHLRAIKLAKHLSWDKNLQNLLTLIHESTT